MLVEWDQVVEILTGDVEDGKTRRSDIDAAIQLLTIEKERGEECFGSTTGSERVREGPGSGQDIVNLIEYSFGIEHALNADIDK